MNQGTEVGPLADTDEYNARNPHPLGLCPVCGAAKLLSRETCSDFCGEMLWLVRKYPASKPK